MGDLFEWEVGSSKATSNVMAFGRRIAYQYSWNQTLRSAWLPPGWELPIAPRWLGPGIALAALSLALAYLLWLAARGAAIVRPLPAALQLLVMASLLIPNPAWAGGGGGASYLRRWISPDHLGNAVLYSDPSGAEVKRRVFEPFGKLVAQTATTEATPRLFTGQRYEASSGLYDFRARWYDPEAGRFLSVDPIVQEVADPQTHNAYGYVRNNPVNFVDPDGLGFLKGLLKALLVIVGVVIMVVGFVLMAVGQEWGLALVAIGSQVTDLGVAANTVANLVPESAGTLDDPAIRASLLTTGVLKAQKIGVNSFQASGDESPQKQANVGVLRLPWPVIVGGVDGPSPILDLIAWAIYISIAVNSEFQAGQILEQQSGEEAPPPDAPPYNEDPTAPPGEGWEWRGPPGSKPGSEKGAWWNKGAGGSGQSVRPHRGPNPHGPHNDISDRGTGGRWRQYPDGSLERKP